MASDADVARLIDPVVQVPLAAALLAVAGSAAWWGSRRGGTGVAVDGAARARPLATDVRTRRAAVVIVAVAVALCVPWGAPEPMDHLEYALVAETDLAESWSEVLVNRVGIEQAHQPLSRLPIALARRAAISPEATRWFQLAAWALALAGAWRWLRGLARWSMGRAGDAADGVALTSLAWIAWSPLGARYGFDATPYGLFACLAWWGAAALQDVARGGAAVRWVAIVLAAAAFYTHYVELWFFAGAWAIAWLETSSLTAVERRRARLDLVTIAAIVALAIVPWLPAMRLGAGLFRRYVSREASLYAMDFPWWAQLRETLRIVTGLPGWWALAGAVLAVGYLAFRGGRSQRVAAVATCVGLAPFFLFRAVQQHQYAEASGGTYFGARHVLPFVPLVVLPIVVALEDVTVRGLGRRTLVRARIAPLALLPLAALASSVAARARADRPDVRGAARYIRAHVQDGDAIGVLPRFFYTPLVVDEVSAGQVRFQDASGFARLPLGRSDQPDPLVWLPADDREFPFPAALENRAFRRVWVIDFQECEFGLRELAPLVSQQVTGRMDQAHQLVERRSFDQLVLSLYVLSRDREGWDGSPWTLDESTWREHARDVSWTVDGGRLVYRIDLPSPRVTGPVELSLVFPAADAASGASPVRLTVGRAVDESFALPASGTTHTTRLVAATGEPLIVLLQYPTVVARPPSRISLRAASGAT